MGIDTNQAREWNIMGRTIRTTPGISGPTIISNTEPFTPEGQNEAVSAWASMVQRYLRGAATLFTKGKDGTVSKPGRIEKKLDASIIGTTQKEFGVINRVTYKFERHGVFVHKGVGRGYQIQGGSVRRVAKSPMSEVRTPAEWFNPVLDQSLPELANKLAEINANAILKESGMMIK